MEQLLVGFVCYFITIGFISYYAYYHNKKSKDSGYSQAILGNRSISYIATAFSAHASDMSDWLFMAFPAAIYSGGLINAWIAIGLVVGMFFVWQSIAPQLRRQTEKYNCMTLSSYFEHHFSDSSGVIRLLSAVISLLFFSVYIAAGLKGFGFLTESVFGLSYFTGITVGLFCVITYIIAGGYTALAWIDCFQALFLLTVIFLVPAVALIHVGGIENVINAAIAKNISLSILPSTVKESINTFLMAFSWAIGYLGTPHILTKFMGMRDVNEVRKAQCIGLTWQILVLFAAGFTGLIGIAFFPEMLANKEMVFIEIVKALFSPLYIGFILSAVAGATLSVMTAQMLVLVSVFTEDIYHKSINKNASESRLLWVYRLTIVSIAMGSFLISFNQTYSIQELVHYAWMGFGCSFGPLVLLSLHSTYINKYGACVSIITGSVIAALWQITTQHFFLFNYNLVIPAVLPGFGMSVVCAYLVTWLTRKTAKSEKLVA